MHTKYSFNELIGMLEDDTTVARGFLLENERIYALIKRCMDGHITYDQLLDAVYEEF